MQAGHARFDRSPLAFFFDHALDFGFGIFDQFFDPGRVNAPILNHLGQRDPGNFAPHRIERGQRHGFRRVVDDNVDTGRPLDGADVAAVAPDDAALHFIVGQRHHTHCHFSGLLGGDALHGQRDNLARALIGLVLNLGLNLAQDTRHITARIGFD